MAAPITITSNLFEQKKLYLDELKKGNILDPVEKAKALDDPTRNEEAYITTIDLAAVKAGWTEEVMNELIKSYFDDVTVKREVLRKIFSDIPNQFGEFEKKLLASFTKVTVSAEDVPPVRIVDAESLYIIYGNLVFEDMHWDKDIAAGGMRLTPYIGERRFPYLSALNDEQKTALTKYVVETRMGIPESRERMEKLYDSYQGRLHELEKKWIKEGKIQSKIYKSDIKCVLVFSGDKTVTGEVSGVLFQLSDRLRNLYGMMGESEGGREPFVITEAQTKEDFLLVVKDLAILVDMFATQGIPWREQFEFDSIPDSEFDKLMAKFTQTNKPLRHYEIMTRVLGRLVIRRDIFSTHSSHPIPNHPTSNVIEIGFDATSIFARAMLNTVVSTSAGKDHVALVTALVEQLWVSDALLQKGKFKSKAEVVRVFTTAVENFQDFKSFNVSEEMLTNNNNNNNNNEDLDELANRFDRSLMKRGTERPDIRAVPDRDGEGNVRGEKVQKPNDARRK